MDRNLTCHWRAKNIGTIANFLTVKECDDFIADSEFQGYEDAPITTSTGMVMMKDIRNNDRVMVDDENQARKLWQRLEAFVPPRFQKKWRPVGLNERLRFYRYQPSQQFDWHLDGYFERDLGERSFFTFMVYLNDDFEGGHTSFIENDHTANSFYPFDIRPQKGMALLFHHPLTHRGDRVESGVKYVLRTDIMFTRQ